MKLYICSGREKFWDVKSSFPFVPLRAKRQSVSSCLLSPSIEFCPPAQQRLSSLKKGNSPLTTAPACLSHVGHHVAVLPAKGCRVSASLPPKGKGSPFPSHLATLSPLSLSPWKATGHPVSARGKVAPAPRSSRTWCPASFSACTWQNRGC